MASKTCTFTVEVNIPDNYHEGETPSKPTLGGEE